MLPQFFPKQEVQVCHSSTLWPWYQLLYYFAFFCRGKHHNQRQFGKGKHLFHLTVAVHPEGSQGRNSGGGWRQELKQRLWKNAAYWLTLNNLLSFCFCFLFVCIFCLFFVQPEISCRGMASLTMGWTLPHQSLRKCPTGRPT